MFKILLAGLIAASINVLAIDDTSFNFVNTLDPLPVSGVPASGIRHLTCKDPKTNKSFWGSSVKVGDHTLITAAHVIEGRVCKDTINDTYYTTVHVDHANDFAIIQTDKVIEGVAYNINCAGYKPGSEYYIAGWALGEKMQFHQVIATNLITGNEFVVDGEVFPGFHRLKGTLINGQSGGPTFDIGGGVVGVNNFTDGGSWAWNIELKKTAICK